MIEEIEKLSARSVDLMNKYIDIHKNTGELYVLSTRDGIYGFMARA